MAPIGRAGLLQLLRGTRQPRQPRGVPTAIAGTVVAPVASPEPEASVLVDPHACVRGSLASATACAPSLPRGSLCRQSSAIRTGCAKKRPSGSVRGVSREWYPYRDLKTACWTRLRGKAWPSRIDVRTGALFGAASKEQAI